MVLYVIDLNMCAPQGGVAQYITEENSAQGLYTSKILDTFI